MPARQTIKPSASPLRLVRRGRAVRLVGPEGTFSYFHPHHLFRGVSWDALTASLLLASCDVQSIAILGLGGGTVARQCRHVFPDARITGVEIDAEVLGWARDHFDLESLRVETVLDSGQEYLRRTRRRFDAIVDDMWPPEPGSPKPLLIDDNLLRIVNRRLRPGGVYAVNLYRQSAELDAGRQRLRAAFPVVCEVRPGGGPTTVLCAGPCLRSLPAVRRRLSTVSRRFDNALDHVRYVTK